MVFEKPQPILHLKELMLALADVLKRIDLNASHEIKMETLSVRERMTFILSSIQAKDFVVFSTLFNPQEGKLGIVVTFLAMLELLKHNMVEIVQASAFGPIHLKAVA